MFVPRAFSFLDRWDRKWSVRVGRTRLLPARDCPDSGTDDDYVDVRTTADTLALGSEPVTGDFARSYTLHVARVFAFVSTRVASRSEAEDVTSDIFERALRSSRSSPPRGRVDRWLFAIARRTLADHYRTRRPAEQLAQAREMPADASGDPERLVLQREQIDAVRAVLAQLGEEQQTIVALRLIAGLSYPDIAAVVGRREAAVKKTTYRALEKVRDHLSRGGLR